MSEENADLLERAVDAYRRDIEALLEELDPEIEWHSEVRDRGDLVVARSHPHPRKASGAKTSPYATSPRSGTARAYASAATSAPREAIDAAGVGSRPEPGASG